MGQPAPRVDVAILVVDDDAAIVHLLESYFSKLGWSVESASSLAGARESLDATDFDVILIDKNLGDDDGMDLAKAVVGRDCEVLMMTAYASIDSAVDAVRLRLSDYLLKPFDDLGDVEARVRRALHTLHLQRRNRALVEELQAKDNELEALVARDPLTGTFNHGFLQDALEREIVLGERHAYPVALILVDVDHFHVLNDGHGHWTGDEVLRRFAEMLRGHLQYTDAPVRLRRGDVVARLGSDRFAIVLPHTAKRSAARKAENVRAMVEDYDFRDLNVEQVTVSAGVAGFPEDAGDRPGLTRAADLALRMAKHCGRNAIHSFDPGMIGGIGSEDEEIANRQKRLETVTNGAFGYWYQPILDLSGAGSIYGYEALVRPHAGTFTSALDLFGTAEALGRVVELGRALRKRALASVLDVPEDRLLFVNLHPHELNDPQLDDIDPAVEEHSERIVFEVTEVSAIRSYEHVTNQLRGLRHTGYRIALDDLGAGYAGLQALSRLDPHFVKIDRFLSQRVRDDRRTASLVRRIIEFAADENIAVVAEGIETAEQRDAILELGCTLMQGYFFAHPAPDLVESVPDHAKTT